MQIEVPPTHLRHAAGGRDPTGRRVEGHRARLDHRQYTDLLQESRRLGSMYFNIHYRRWWWPRSSYFIVCWLRQAGRMAAVAHAAACNCVRTGTGRADRHHGSVRLIEPDRRGQAMPLEWRTACPVLIGSFARPSTSGVRPVPPKASMRRIRKAVQIRQEWTSIRRRCVQDEGRWQGQEQVRSRRIAPVSHNTRRGRFFRRNTGEAAPFVSTMDCAWVSVFL